MLSRYYVVSLSVFYLVILHKVNLASSAENANKKHPEPVNYNVKDFNGTVLVELEDGKEVIPVDVGHKVGKVIVRVGNEKRVHFNLDEKKKNKTAVLTLKRYNGNIILRGGNQTVEIKSNNKANPGPHHVGLIYI